MEKVSQQERRLVPIGQRLCPIGGEFDFVAHNSKAHSSTFSFGFTIMVTHRLMIQSEEGSAVRQPCEFYNSYRTLFGCSPKGTPSPPPRLQEFIHNIEERKRKDSGVQIYSTFDLYTFAQMCTGSVLDK